MYRLFTDEEHVTMPKLPSAPGARWGRTEKQSKELQTFARALLKMDERHQKLLMTLAQHMAKSQ